MYCPLYLSYQGIFMNLNETFAVLAHEDTLTLEPSWAQGRALYGGLIGALMLAKLMHVIGAPRRLRSLTVSFVGPIDAGGDITLKAEILRVGKSALQGEVHLWQNEAVQAVLLASFGEERHSTLVIDDILPRPQWAAPHTFPDLPLRGEGIPNFFQHFDVRWVSGSLPFSGSLNADFGGYVRFRGQEGAFDVRHLLCLTDAFPPSVTVMTDRPVPSSSLAWTFELLQEPQDMGMEDFWQYAVHTDYVHEGYGHSEARLWDKNGRVVAISRQTVTIFT